MASQEHKPGSTSGNLIYHKGEIQVHPFVRRGRTGLPHQTKAFEHYMDANPDAWSVYYAHRIHNKPEGLFHDLVFDRLDLPGVPDPLETPIRGFSLLAMLPKAVLAISAAHKMPARGPDRIELFPTWFFAHPRIYAGLSRWARKSGYAIEPRGAKQPETVAELEGNLRADLRDFSGKFRSNPLDDAKNLGKIENLLDILKPDFSDASTGQGMLKAISRLSRQGWNPHLAQIFPSLYIGYVLRRK